MNTCVLIPSYNEAKSIGTLVKKIKSRGLDVLVVDDGSVDQTAEVARQSGAWVLRYTQNRGKGASLKAGFRSILNNNYDAVITMDGDGQHSPEDISKFIHAAADDSVDMIIGNRMSVCKNMPFIRWITNNMMSWLLSLICWRNIPDSQCGFRMIKSNVLRKLELQSSNYEIESETIIAAHHQGFKIKFIPIQTIYAKQNSQINPFIDTLRFFRFILTTFYPFLFSRRR